MAASQVAPPFSSKMSIYLRHLLLRQSTARSTAIASSAAVSLTGKLPPNDSPAISSSYEKPKLAENGGFMSFLGRVDWPAFHHQQVIHEVASRGTSSRKVVPHDEDDADYVDDDSKDSDCSDVDVDFSEFDDDDDDDEDEYDDDDGRM